MTIDDLRLIGDRILVRPDPKEKFSEGGLIELPDTVLADNPNYYYVSGVVVKLGQGYREDVYECSNAQCRMQCRRGLGERCPKCGATQTLAYADEDRKAFDVQVGDRVHFGRFAGTQIDVQVGVDRVAMRPVVVRHLVVRESDIRGVLTDVTRVTHGYEPASKGRVTKGLTA